LYYFLSENINEINKSREIAKWINGGRKPKKEHEEKVMIKSDAIIIFFGLIVVMVLIKACQILPNKNKMNKISYYFFVNFVITGSIFIPYVLFYLFLKLRGKYDMGYWFGMATTFWILVAMFVNSLYGYLRFKQIKDVSFTHYYMFQLTMIILCIVYLISRFLWHHF